MSVKIFETVAVQDFVRTISGLESAEGNPRTKQILQRVIGDAFKAIEDLDITADEFWTAVNYFNELGAAGEAGLAAAGFGFEKYLDMRMDAADAAAGVAGVTPRTIEGPLYVAGAPVAQGKARLDVAPDPDGGLLVMHGQVRDASGKPLPGASVEVWHCNTKGMYSFFDSSQSSFNLRRTIIADGDGRYEFRSTVPAGYGCPPGGPTQNLLDAVGRHGQRPAHIHFFINADGHRHLTTQINIDGDEYLHDDFAFATRDDLIPAITRVDDAAAIQARGLEGPFAEIAFDFVLLPKSQPAPDTVVQRKRAAA